MTVTRELARYVVESRPEDIPDDVRQEARRAIVNIVGCILGGAPEEGTAIAARVFGPLSGPATAQIVGRRERLDEVRTALVNGIASHYHDFDDTLPKNYIHASPPVAAALLAYASAHPVDGAAFLHAFVLGFEVTSRIGNATYPTHYDAGWHSTGTCGVFGAAAAIGKLLGLSVDEMVCAFGLAATQASGIREMFGSMAQAVPRRTRGAERLRGGAAGQSWASPAAPRRWKARAGSPSSSLRHAISPRSPTGSAATSTFARTPTSRSPAGS